MKMISNERGIAALALAVIVAILVGILISMSAQNMNHLLNYYGRHKILYDSTLAVEKFGLALKASYDKANPYGTIMNVGVPVQACNVQPAGGPGGMPLCWNFTSGTGNQLCYERGLGLAPICLDRLASFPALNPVIYVKLEQERPSWRDYTRYFFETFLDNNFLPEAHAAEMQRWRPPLPVNTANIIEHNVGAVCTPLNISTQACKNYRTVPKDSMNCIVANPDLKCLHVQFCLKYGGNCAPAELVKQTYLFYTKPSSVLGD